MTTPASPTGPAAPPRDGAFVVPDGIKRRPLDGVLRELLGATWGAARKLIETGKVSVNGEVVTDPLRYVWSGQKVVVTMTAPRPQTQQRLAREAIAYEDHDVVVVRKPAGISTVPFEEGEQGTLDQLVRALLNRERKARGGHVQGSIGVVHRLDKETTGLIVFARTLSAKKHLAQQFRVHSVHRRYAAIVHGELTQAMTIRSHLVADRGDGLRGSTRQPGQGQLAITHVKPLEKLRGASLVECRLETGRTHQIRIHLAERGHALVGERVYIRDHQGPKIAAPRIMLHARELGFVHPETGEELLFEEPLPDDMERVLAGLRGPEAVP